MFAQTLALRADVNRHEIQIRILLFPLSHFSLDVNVVTAKHFL